MRGWIIKLWVRSQDKMLLEKVDGITLARCDRDGVEIYSTSTGRIFGIYKTQERALEVLDEIQKILTPVITYERKTPKESIQDGIYQIRQEVDMKIQELSTYVYQMPKE